MYKVSHAIIRDATSADIPAAAALGAVIVRIHHETNPQRFFMLENVEHGYEWWLSKEIARPEAIVLVAELESRIVGYAYGAIEDRDWSILVDRHGAFHDLCVAEHVRRLGIGRELGLEIIARLEARGAPRILLRAMVQNESAQHLASALGFAPTMIEMTREGTRTVATRGG
ncbi:MAG TPA: GNAT family N-acetyltransferase [Polyangiaceae bacterium]|nr:GNAT family N-acetyltransferase [Polyangiaceae bacterium]